MPEQDVYIISAVRTAVGKFGGSLSAYSAAELGAQVVAEAVLRSSLALEGFEHCVMGHVMPSCAQDYYLSRYAALSAGLPQSIGAMNVNRLCGSGLQAVVSAAQIIKLNEANTVVAGGSECMSQAPFWLHARWGQKLGDLVQTDALMAALSDPFEGIAMGVTAENVAKKWQIGRARQDNWAVSSHSRATHAQAEGRFKKQVLAVTQKSVNARNKEPVLFRVDEQVKPETRFERIASLPAVFQKDGTVTAANAASINDGAAALVLVSEDTLQRNGTQPLARVLGWDYSGVDPRYMGIGPVAATLKLLKRFDLCVDDLDVIELNEAFAAQTLAVMDELGLDESRTNPNGSGISIGHPIGATGAVILVKAVYELRRIQGRYALVTMCIGGGQGISLLLERV